MILPMIMTKTYALQFTIKSIHRLLYTWTEDWIIFFPNSIPAKSAKYGFTIICRYSKDMNFHKIWKCSSKIEPITPILILKFKRAWQTQFFSHILQILVNDRFSIGYQMIFYSIFCTSNRKAKI